MQWCVLCSIVCHSYESKYIYICVKIAESIRTLYVVVQLGRNMEWRFKEKARHYETTSQYQWIVLMFVYPDSSIMFHVSLLWLLFNLQELEYSSNRMSICFLFSIQSSHIFLLHYCKIIYIVCIKFCSQNMQIASILDSFCLLDS